MSKKSGGKLIGKSLRDCLRYLVPVLDGPFFGMKEPMKIQLRSVIPRCPRDAASGSVLGNPAAGSGITATCSFPFFLPNQL
jgi:hypothetical protein